MSKNQFTGTAPQPQRNRKLCQFNKDQYCNGKWSDIETPMANITLDKHVYNRLLIG